MTTAEPRERPPRQPSGARPWLPGLGGLLLALAGAVLFTQIAAQVLDGGPLLGLDPRLLHDTVLVRTPALVGVFSVLTWLGSTPVVVPLALLTAMVLTLRTRSGVPLLLVILGQAANGLTASLVKAVIARPRPAPPIATMPEDGFAFPSAHSANAAFAYLLLGTLLLRLVHTRWARASVVLAALLLVVVTGLSRVVLGVHSPTDVLGGWTLGATWTVLLLTLWHLGGRLRGVVRRPG